MLDVDVKGAAKIAVDEVASKYPPELLQALVDHLIEGGAQKLKEVLVGRKITVTIE